MSLAGIAIGARRCMLPTISACRGYATSSQKGLNQNNVKSHLSLTTSARFTKSHFAGVAGLVSALVGWRLFSIAAHAEAPFKGESETKAEPEIILYQYDPCPFCNKVRAYMDYHNIEYKVVEVNPMGKKEMAFTDYKKVPLAMINGEEVRDSVRIIDYLQNQRKDLGKTTVQRTESTDQWREWMGTTLEKLISPNLYRTPSESLKAFEYITTVSNFTTFEALSAKYFGAFVMYLIGKRNKNRLGITDERQAMYDALDKWVDEGVADKQFEGGDAPAMIDLEVFGICKALSNMPVFGDIMKNSKVGPWFVRMRNAVGDDMRILPQATQ